MKKRHLLTLVALVALTPQVLFATWSGSVLSTVEINSSSTNGPELSDSDLFGKSVASIGDLDGDGVQDIATGAPFDDEGGADRGAVHIHFMNSDGSVKETVEINSSTLNGPELSNNDYFGFSVASIGDLNGDGVQDLGVGAYGDDEGGSFRGAVHILFMNTDGSVDSTVEINSSTVNGPTLSNSDGFGVSIAGIGDLNGDEVQDLAVGAWGDDEGGNARGAVHILFMNTDGSVDSTVEINSSTTNGPTLDDSDTFGWGYIANIGDLNGDDVTDIAVGAIGDDEEGSSRGTVHLLFLNSDGSVDSTAEINSSTLNGPILDDVDQFGWSIAKVGDLDGDGVVDIAVGSVGDDAGGDSRGAVHILFLNTDGSVDSTVEINSSTVSGPTLDDGDGFGSSVANVGDLNGDGVRELAVGARTDDEGGTNRGAVHIIFLEPLATASDSNDTPAPANGMILNLDPSALPNYVAPTPQMICPDGTIITLTTLADANPALCTSPDAQTPPPTTQPETPLLRQGYEGQAPTFTRDLTLGDTGTDVQALQQFLNQQGYTLASTGSGAPGQETDYFGSLTQSALARFQAANGIQPAVGYFGPITRGFIAENY